MTKSNLLPVYNVKNQNNKFRIKIYNEKSLVVLLLLISIITVFIILMNLPSDIQRVVSKEELHNVFIPEVNQNFNHEQFHQHPPPPIFNGDGSKFKNSDSINKQLPNQQQQQHDTNSDDSITQKREAIRKMTLHGWSNYEKYAWGENELRPISKIGHSAGVFGSRPTKLGATIIDGLDTLYLMGFMDEYKRGRDWIIKNLNINVNSDVSAFEINIRFIGGLLSLFTLTNEKVYVEKAEEIATKLLPIFDTPTGIPYALINPITKAVKNYNWASGSCSILAEFGTLSLEFQYLTDLTGNQIFAQKINKIIQVLDEVEKENGLYYNYLNPHNGKWCMKHTSVGALGDSFYEYLLKLWIYKDKKDKKLLDMYLSAINALQDKLIQVSENNLTYFGDYKSSRVEKKMDHLACFSGGLLALTSVVVDTIDQNARNNYLDMAKKITHTCHESYARSAIGLGPEAFHFERKDAEAMAIRPDEKYYILRPEVVESYFYLWRLTKDNKYREWAWDAAQAIEKHCRTDNGYSGIKDVYEKNPLKDDVQQSFFFAETLKYLFLIFSEDSVLPLDKYVFNSEAHPFNIKKQ